VPNDIHRLIARTRGAFRLSASGARRIAWAPERRAVRGSYQSVISVACVGGAAGGKAPLLPQHQSDPFFRTAHADEGVRPFAAPSEADTSTGEDASVVDKDQ